MSVLHMSQIIGVVGSGTMGNGIAQVAARAGHAVVMCDVKEEVLQRGLSAIDKSLQRDVDKQRLTIEEKGGIIGLIKTATNLEALSGASFVIEAVTEDLNVKTELFKRLDRITPPDAILASNTSSISITKLGASPQSHRSIRKDRPRLPRFPGLYFKPRAAADDQRGDFCSLRRRRYAREY